MRLSIPESRRRFASASVARLATVDDTGRPHAVPVTFALDDDVLAFAVDHKPKTTRHLKRLRNIAANPHVSLLVDEYADDWNHLWWVRADGVAETVTDAVTRERLLGLLGAKYPQYRDHPPAGPVVRVAITTWRGWAASAPE